MRTISMRFFASVPLLAVISVAAMAQNQAQQNQAQQNQSQNQNQPQQAPQKKKSFWQTLKESAAQRAQGTVQQGTDAAQGAVQQGTNAAQGAVQQGTNSVQNGAQQMQGGAQQGMQGMQQAAFPGGNGAFSGGGGGAGACGATCFDAGPFQANVSQMTMSQQGGWHIIRMNIQFHNSTNQPLAIAYHDGSMVMVDNNGSTYQAAGGQPGALQGMGVDRGNQTDSQFVLGPGQTGNALFSTARYRDQTSPVGTAYSYNFTIDELQAQNGAMAIPVRTYDVNFPSLTPGAAGNAAFASGASPAMGYTGGATTANAMGGGVMRPPSSQTVAPGVQQRAVNARAVNANTVSTPAAVSNARAATVSNAAIRTPVTANTARPTAAARPVPATTKTATPAKKTTTATTTTTTR